MFLRFIILGMVTSIVLATSPVLATFPGENGRIAYTAVPSSTGGSQIFLTDSGQLTFPPFPGAFLDFTPAFSPDGKQIAFIRQTLAGSGYLYQLMVVGTDGAGLGQVADSRAFDPDGIVPFHSVHSPAWLSDGQRISVVVTNLGANDGIWTVGGSGGPVQTVQGSSSFLNYVNWSPVRDEMVYTCTFRPTMGDLCVYNPVTKDLRQLPIDWPGRFFGTGPGEPKWTPDGAKIVFFLEYRDGKVGRFDIFSVNADGTGLTKLSDSGPDLCPDDPSGVSSFFYFSPTPSPDGKSIVAIKWKNVLLAAKCGVFRGMEKSLSILDSDQETLLLAEPFLINGTDWQPIRSNLTLKLDDGHDKPLKGLKVELRKLDGSVVDDHPINTIEGTYVFEKEIPPDDYVVRATLVDNAASPGSLPAFDIRYSPTPSEPVWLEMRIPVPAGSVTLARSFSQDNPDLFDYGPGSSLILRGYLDDMANIYFRTRQFVDWVKTHLTADTGPTVEFYTFATAHPFGGSTDPNVAGAFYNQENTAIVFGIAESEYETRDGVDDSAHDDDAPENGEWHEFTHHLFYTFVNSRSTCLNGHVAHYGYNNPDTCDSMDEGFANFLPTLAARDIEGGADDQYDNFGFFLEENRKAWGYRKIADSLNPPGMGATKEDWAVASLFWDLVDVEADTEDTQVIAADFVHDPVTYIDQVTVPLQQLWNQLTSDHPATVFDLRSSFGQPALTRDLDGDGVMDIAPIDEVFLMHGFFPVDTDQTINSSHMTYHYDVGYSQRITPSARRNGSVGATSHRVFDASGAVTTTLSPRFHTPLDPQANLEIHVVNAAGIPLADATITMLIRFPSFERTVSRRLASGDGALVHLELAPYFDYLLPAGAPLPACDPAHDFHVDVTVSAIVNGVSSNTISFDNCAYLQAIHAATGPAALSFILTVPTTGGGSPEVCDGMDNDLDGHVDEGLGTLSCGVGACARTVDVCVNGVGQTCTPGTPTAEICGDGVDQDCDGADLSCPVTPLNNVKGVLNLDLDQSEDKVAMQAVAPLPGATAQAVLPAPGIPFDPFAEGATLRLEQAGNLVVNLQFPPGEGWKVNKKGSTWSFTDKKDGSLGDPSKDSVRVQCHTKKQTCSIKVNVRETELGAVTAGEITATIIIGDDRFQKTQEWKEKAKRKKLVTP